MSLFGRECFLQDVDDFLFFFLFLVEQLSRVPPAQQPILVNIGYLHFFRFTIPHFGSRRGTLNWRGKRAKNGDGRVDLVRYGAFLTVGLVAAATIAPAQNLEYPVDVGVNADGVVFVADHQAHALLKLDGGTFQIVAKGEGAPRTPLFGIRHIALDKEGRWIASDPATMKLYRIDAEGTFLVVPDDDGFVTPWGVVVEPSGDILAVDRVTHRLRRVTTDGKVTDVTQVQAPRSVLFDKDGSILVLTDRNLMRVSSGNAEALLKDPPFELPHDAVLHPNGNLYVSDGYAKTIWQIDPQGQISALAQGEPLDSPQGLAVDGEGNLLVADPHARAIFKVNVKGEVSVLAR